MSEDSGPERRDDAAAETEARNPGSGQLAVFGALYVMWGLGWVVGVSSTPVIPVSGVLDAVMYRVGEFFAYIVTPLWFVAVILLGSEWSARRRAGILALGLLLLLPWPFLLPVVMAP